MTGDRDQIQMSDSQFDVTRLGMTAEEMRESIPAA
jgi:hypothetical protein